MSKVRLLICESWQGKRPLYKVFWVYTVLGSFAVTFAFLLFLWIASLLPALLGLIAIFGMVLGLIIWNIWALVSVWRCAPNSTAPAYKYLARGYIVLIVLTLAFEATEKYEDYRQRGERIKQQDNAQ